MKYFDYATGLKMINDNLKSYLEEKEETQSMIN